MKKVISNDSEINWQGATLSYVYFFIQALDMILCLALTNKDVLEKDDITKLETH